MTAQKMPSMDPFDRSACEQTIHELYHFLDGELTEAKRIEIEYHLDHCGPCVDIVSFESDLRRVIADRCKEQIPQGLRDRIARLIDHELDASEPGA